MLRDRSASTAVSCLLAVLTSCTSNEPATQDAPPPIVEPAAARAAPQDREPKHFVPGELLVRWRGGPDATLDFVRGREDAFGLERVRAIPELGVYLYQFPPDQDLSAMVDRLRGDDAVEMAERNWLYRIEGQPDDPDYAAVGGEAGDLQKWVFDGLAADRNLDAEAAWDLSVGDPAIVVAVVDSGVDLDHPDLKDNLWKAPSTLSGSVAPPDPRVGVHGWDFEDGDADPGPDLGNAIDDDFWGGADSNTAHGTQVASCIGAVGDNGVGVAGAAWRCGLMALKVLGDDGGAKAFDVADALVYAAKNGARVVNLSLAFKGLQADSSQHQSLQAAVDFAWGRDTLVVAPAGNSASTTSKPPASLQRVLSVGATDSGCAARRGSMDLDGRADFSNHGPGALDVVAPGRDLYGASVFSAWDAGSQGKGGATYAFLSGTSYAAPLASGLAVLVLDRARDGGVDLTAQQLVGILLDSAVDLPADADDTSGAGPDWDGHGRLSFRRALERTDALLAELRGVPPEPPVEPQPPQEPGTAGSSSETD